MTRAAVRSLTLLLIGLVAVSTPALLFAQTFQPQIRLGASLPGDTWEPAIAARFAAEVRNKPRKKTTVTLSARRAG